MRLLSDELRARLPQLYSQESSDDPIVYAKFFLPGTGWTWYVTEVLRIRRRARKRVRLFPTFRTRVCYQPVGSSRGARFIVPRRKTHWCRARAGL